MCTRYITPEMADIERLWQVGRADGWRGGVQLFPRSTGGFIRATGNPGTAGRAFVLGQWGLIPWFAKTARLPYATVNARYEEIATKASYRDPWRRGQRCVVPVAAFDEPCWETGRNVWWRFRRADGDPWGLAGLWADWTDPATGEIVPSYTLLTLNADAHPLMSRMHKPDPKLGPDQQDKRSVVALAPEDVATWLHAPLDEARALVRLTPVDAFDAGPLPGIRFGPTPTDPG